MADDDGQRSRLSIGNESWALRKATPPPRATSDVGLRRPFTGGGPLHSRVTPSVRGFVKRPATAGAEKSQSLLVAGSNANAGRFGIRHSGNVQPIRSAPGHVGLIRDGGSTRSFRRSDDILGAPTVATDVPREIPGYPEPSKGDEDGEENPTEKIGDCDQDVCSDEDEVEHTIESLREHLTALQSYPDNLQSRFRYLDDLLKEKENDILLLEQRNLELDNDIDVATVKIDDYVKQEKEIREQYNALDEQYAATDREKLEFARELDLAKKGREDLEAELNEQVESFRLHVSDCEAAAAKKDELLHAQETDLAMKGQKVKEMSEELSYVQRKIENIVDQLRVCEKKKAQQGFDLRKAQESREILDVKLSKASEEKRILQMELSRERHTAKSSLVSLKAKIRNVLHELFDYSHSQLRNVRDDLLYHKQANHELSTQVRCLQTNAGAVEDALDVIIENGASAHGGGVHLRNKLDFCQEDLQSAVRNLRNLSLEFDSGTLKGGTCGIAIQRLSTLFADSMSKNTADNSMIALLRDENNGLKRDHRVVISDIHRNLQKHASVLKSASCQTVKDLELVRSRNVDVITAAVLQLKALYHMRAKALAHTYAEFLSDLSDRFLEHGSELKDSRKTFCAGITRDIFSLEGKLEEMKRCLMYEQREHRGSRRRGHELESALLAKSEELIQLQHSSSLAANITKELERRNDSLTLNLENANLELHASKRKCAEMLETLGKDQDSIMRLKSQVNTNQRKSEENMASLEAKLREAWNESHVFAKAFQVELDKARKDCQLFTKAIELQVQKVGDDSRREITSAYNDACSYKEKMLTDLQMVCKEAFKLKTQNEGAQKLLLAKERERAVLIRRVEGAESVLLRSKEASNALKMSAKKSETRAELAEAALSRLQDSVGTLEMRAEKSEVRAAEAEAARSRLQDAAKKLEERAKNCERLAMSNGEDVSKNLQLENESLIDDLRRAKSLVAETEGNLRESAQMTLNALSEKDAIAAKLSTCQEMLKKEKKEVDKLTSELALVTKNTEANRNALNSEIEAGQVAIAKGQSEMLRSTSDPNGTLTYIQKGREKQSHELSISQDAPERESKEQLELVLEFDTLAKNAAKSEEALSEGRKDIARMRSESGSQMRIVQTEKEELRHAIASSRAVSSIVGTVPRNLSTEISAQAERVAAEKEALVNENRVINKALSEEQCKTKRTSCETKDVVTDDRKVQHGIISIESNSEEARKSNLDVAPQTLKNQHGHENSNGSLSLCRDILREGGGQVPETLAPVRKSLRKKKPVQLQVPHHLSAAPSAVESGRAYRRDGPTSDMKLKLQQKKETRVGFKRPRAIGDEKQSAPRARSERTAKHRAKRTKKCEAASPSVARLGSDDDDDWMVG